MISVATMRGESAISVLIAPLALLVSCTAPAGAPNVSAADFEKNGLKWPLTVPDGTIGCSNGAIWFERAGVRYGVNGRAQPPAYRSIDPIWLEDAEMTAAYRKAGGNGPATRVDIGDLIKAGQVVC